MSEPDNPLHAMIRNTLRDPNTPFGLMTKLRATDRAAADRLEAVFGSVIAGSRKEPGNLTYHVNRDAADPTLFVLYDRWRSLRAVIDHEASPHFKAGVAQLKGADRREARGHASLGGRRRRSSGLRGRRGSIPLGGRIAMGARPLDTKAPASLREIRQAHLHHARGTHLSPRTVSPSRKRCCCPSGPQDARQWDVLADCLAEDVVLDPRDGSNPWYSGVHRRASSAWIARRIATRRPESRSLGKPGRRRDRSALRRPGQVRREWRARRESVAQDRRSRRGGAYASQGRGWRLAHRPFRQRSVRPCRRGSFPMRTNATGGPPLGTSAGLGAGSMGNLTGKGRPGDRGGPRHRARHRRTARGGRRRRRDQLRPRRRRRNRNGRGDFGRGGQSVRVEGGRQLGLRDRTALR